MKKLKSVKGQVWEQVERLIMDQVWGQVYMQVMRQVSEHITWKIWEGRGTPNFSDRQYEEVIGKVI